MIEHIELEKNRIFIEKLALSRPHMKADFNAMVDLVDQRKAGKTIREWDVGLHIVRLLFNSKLSPIISLLCVIILGALLLPMAHLSFGTTALVLILLCIANIIVGFTVSVPIAWVFIRLSCHSIYPFAVVGVLITLSITAIYSALESYFQWNVLEPHSMFFLAAPWNSVAALSYWAVYGKLIDFAFLTKPQVERSHLAQSLPYEFRGDILILKALDHYVQVTTDKGQTELRMNLSEAIKKIENTPGIQCHRSYWINARAIKSLKRESRKYLVETEFGDVPVSANRVQDVRLLLDTESG
jgi:hypothetical protein